MEGVPAELYQWLVCVRGAAEPGIFCYNFSCWEPNYDIFIEAVTMPAMDDPQRHWRELAEQLGLPPEPAEPRASAAYVPQNPEADIDLPAVEPKIEEGGRDYPPATADLIEGTKPSVARETPAAAEQTQPEEEPRRTSVGRRRRRRPSRHPEESGRDAEPTEPAEEATSTDEPPIVEETREDGDAPRGRSRRRGRGRSRRKKEVADNSEKPVAVEEESEPTQKSPQTADEDADDDGNDMSGWSIPSWQELIDSLYRPDR
jgi:hypothetical protein